MKLFLAGLAKLFLKTVYFFQRMARTDGRMVLFLSRQGDEPSLDFRLTERALREAVPGVHIKLMCRCMGGGAGAMARYLGYTLRQMHYIARAKVIVTDTYSIPVSVLRHKAEQFIIQTWHAMGPLKKFGCQTLGKAGGRDEKVARALNIHENYDMIFSGSQAMIPYFASAFGTPEEAFAVVRQPKIDWLRAHEGELRQSIRAAHPGWEGKKVLLYAPTFRRERDYSAEKLIDAIDYDRCALIVKGHPIKKLEVCDPRVSVCGESAFELLAAADAVITDYSGISIEAAAIGRELWFYVYDIDRYTADNGLNIDPRDELPGCVYEDARGLAAAIAGGAYDHERLARFAGKYIEDDPRGAAQRIAEKIAERLDV